MDRECDFCNLIINQIASWGLVVDVDGDEVVMCGYCYWVEPHYFDIDDPSQKDFITIVGGDENSGNMDFQIIIGDLK
jgi:ferredoxin